MKMKALLLALMLSCSGCYRVVAGYGLKPNPSFQVFDAGPLTNLNLREPAKMNAAQHFFWSINIAVIGHMLDGERGMCRATAAWAGYKVFEETLYHSVYKGPSAAAEERTDYLSSLIVPAGIGLYCVLRK